MKNSFAALAAQATLPMVAALIVLSSGTSAFADADNPATMMIDGKPALISSSHRLNVVDSPSELSRWWVEVVDTEIGRGVLDAIAGYFGCTKCGTLTVEAVNLAVHQEDNGNEHTGWIQSPVGYTVHHAWVDQPSVNCNGTFNGSYRVASDPDSGNIDGLHWYMVVPTPRIGEGRCWVDGVVNVVFAYADARNPALATAAPTGSIAFQYGQ